MERCVRSARAAGVFREFHVFSDCSIAGARCYETGEAEVPAERQLLVYLSAGVKKLGFDYMVWLESGAVFRRVPGAVLRVLAGGPLHLPLLRELNDGNREAQVGAVYRAGGVLNAPYLADGGFWVVKRSAIEHVCALAAHGIALGEKAGLQLTGTEALGYVCQMLCGNPARHFVERHNDLWQRRSGGSPERAAIVLES